MKAVLGLVLACGACCALPVVVGGLIGSGAIGIALSLWHWEVGAAFAVTAVLGGIAIWYRRRRAGASCEFVRSNSIG